MMVSQGNSHTTHFYAKGTPRGVLKSRAAAEACVRVIAEGQDQARLAGEARVAHKVCALYAQDLFLNQIFFNEYAEHMKMGIGGNTLHALAEREADSRPDGCLSLNIYCHTGPLSVMLID